MGKLRALGLTTLLGQMGSMFINKQKHDQKEEEDPLTLVEGNINGCGHHRQQYASSSKKNLKTELPYHPAIPVLGIYIWRKL